MHCSHCPYAEQGRRRGQHAMSRYILNDGTQRMRCLLYSQMFGHVRSPGISVSLLPHVRRRPSGDGIEAYYSLAIKAEWQIPDSLHRAHDTTKSQSWSQLS